MIHYIVNPTAGAGKALAAIPLIEKAMRESKRPYEFIYTEKPDDVERVSALINRSEGADSAIVCVGGDGTTQEYVGLCVGSGARFGIIPAGSGNDFLRSVPGGVRKFRSFEEKILFHVEKILHGNAVDIDVIAINGKRHLLNIGGAGLDIQVLKDAIPLKKRFGSAAYLLSLVKNAASYNSMEMSLTIDGVRETGRYTIIAVCNGRYYGGNLRVAPPALIDDGKITLCKVAAMSKLKRIMMFPTVKPGWHSRMKETSFVECSTVKFEYNGVMTINLDGNLVDYESPLEFKIIRGAVKLIGF